MKLEVGWKWKIFREIMTLNPAQVLSFFYSAALPSHIFAMFLDIYWCNIEGFQHVVWKTIG
jgi:hypothetical protein